MARYHVQMTFEAPQARARQEISSGPMRGVRIRYITGDGTVAVLASVRADSAADAAMDVTPRVVRAWERHGTGPIRLATWRAVRERVLVGGRRRDDVTGSGFPFDEGGDGGGTAGVREPRRPKPSPGSMSAALEIPRETL